MPPDPDSRPSRRAWPIRTQPTTTAAGTHDHGQPQWPFVIAYALLVVLAVGLTFLLVYVLGRGLYRDEQDQRMHEQIRERICSVLDSLPEGGLLDQARRENDCGPGVPIASYPPEIQDRLRSQLGRPALPAEATSELAQPTNQATPRPTPEPTPVAPAGPPPPTTAPTTQPSPIPAPPAPTTPPPDEPSPLIRLVCDTTGICLEVP